MTTPQNRHGAPDLSGPPQQQSGPHRVPQQYPGPQGPGHHRQQYAQDPRGAAPQGRAPHHQPRPQHSGGYPNPYYDGNPDVPFGGPPFGRTNPGGMPQQQAPAGAQPWPSAAQRTAVPQQRTAAPAVAAPAVAPRNGFGVTALVLGILGLLFSFIPFIGVIAWPLVLLGLLFGVLGVVRASRGRADNRGVAIAGTVLSAVGLVICVLYASVFAAAVSGLPTASSTGTPPAASGDAAGAFPGATADDVVGDAGGTLTVGNLQIAASPLTPGDSPIGQTLCSDVTYTNTGSGTESFNGGFDWKLQDPNGAALMTTLLGSDTLLTAGQLAPGGTMTGTVCFDRPSGATGQYVLLYDAMDFSSSRGAWLNQVG
ncbi:hypothetical protein Ae406Ps2_3225c [Pseudonocardia sp. Ae406_Ps2]|uniref:DUF4190 domain-containing protein n=1 Tax=unclassified Pseudonocardia TaxID=2619320 RepID=UPI00094B5978|nr:MULTISPECIES: DUF4190 domain-containing protein [unclassified Pseudonocardia]OLL99035.1 hypothetical protein Ae331Ps2_2702 [Pseudonocardia sp. Ae331_Ps2]OLM03225.1 hypothetical protein Ae406Ps2_3225c [Pseudonocardia sp. Ae406_Ps2]OLM24784.1 hypothetical protein Ae706Ps2_3217c [Pseudonocardia sp. Ae706_Ps2]